MNKIKIGIPRALLYHKYNILWSNFFNNLKNVEVVVSPETNKEIISRGSSLTVDESCLSMKLFIGHVDYLVGKVDYVFIPRMVSVRRGEELCTKFMGLTETVRNIFDNLPVLSYTVNKSTFRFEFMGMMRVALKLHQSPITAVRAYIIAHRKYKEHFEKRLVGQDNKIKNIDRTKPVVLIVSHPYTTYDGFFGMHISKILGEQGIELLYSDIVNPELAHKMSKNLSSDLYWTYNKEMIGAIEIYKPYIDGIIYLVVFPCGPDALVVNLCQNKIKNIPSAVITLDELQGEAGLKTRLESFADILKIRKSRTNV